jgi:type IV secretion system protein TrbL
MSENPKVLAIDLNPLHWLGSAASAAIGDVWKSAMTGLWSAALWLLKLAFRIIDAFTTPDLSGNGPMGAVLPTTLWAGATLAVVMMFVQLTVALLRRDGQSLGRVLIGIGQFGLVWVGYLGIGAGLVAAAAGLERGILQAMVHVDSLSGVDFDKSWPNQVDDITLATVLGVLSILVVIPAAFFYVLIMFVREAALIILVATAPISAGGLTSEVGRVWFWKTLRWFFACLLISPCAALLLGIGVRLSDGVINPPTSPWPCPHGLAKCPPPPGMGQGDVIKALATAANEASTAHAGMAVVGCIVIAIGAVCPLILFRLLAFVEPSTASGAALRQSWSDAGGLSGVVSGRGGFGGAPAATAGSADGRSAGEAGAESAHSSRLTGALGAFGVGMQLATRVAHAAVDLGSDVLGEAGVGHPSYSLTPTDTGTRSIGPASSSRAPAMDWDDDPGTAGPRGVPPDPPPSRPTPAKSRAADGAARAGAASGEAGAAGGVVVP